MFRLSLFRGSLVVFALIFMSGVISVSPAIAQSSSTGCALINAAFWDAHVAGGYPISDDYNAGDQITVTANPPTSVNTPTIMRLIVNSVIIDTTAFPGTLSYTFPADTTTTVGWTLDNGNADWTVSCSPGVAPPPPPPPVSPGVPVNTEAQTMICPIFFDGRINHRDTFNPVVLYGYQDDDVWGLDVYAADNGEFLWRIPAETINAIETCPAESTEIARNIELDIVLLRLSTCQFFLTAPMNEAGKYYHITFDELYPYTYYESGTAFLE